MDTVPHSAWAVLDIEKMAALAARPNSNFFIVSPPFIIEDSLSLPAGEKQIALLQR